MIYEICAIAATIAFIILVIFIVSTLVTLKKTLIQTNETVSQLKVRAELLSTQSVELMNNVNLITASLREQLDTLTPLFQSVKQLGLAMKGLTESLKEDSFRYSYTKKHSWQDKLLEGIELAGLAANIWKSFQKEHAHGDESYSEKRRFSDHAFKG